MTSPSHHRNAGLRRLSRLTRWVAGTAVALTGAFSVMAARGTTTRVTSPGSASAATQVQDSGDPSQVTGAGAAASSANDGGSQDPGAAQPLAPPASPPQSARSAPVVVSGGS